MKGKLPTGEIERFQFDWPEAHTRPLVAFTIPSVAKVRHKLLALQRSVVGPAGPQRSARPGSLSITCSYRQCFHWAFHGLIVHSEGLI